MFAATGRVGPFSAGLTATRFARMTKSVATKATANPAAINVCHRYDLLRRRSSSRDIT
jgi:hypothetical protein